MAVNQGLSHLSDHFLMITLVLYFLAVLAFAADFAFGKRSSADPAEAAVPELVTAGAAGAGAAGATAGRGARRRPARRIWRGVRRPAAGPAARPRPAGPACATPASGSRPGSG